NRRRRERARGRREKGVCSWESPFAKPEALPGATSSVADRALRGSTLCGYCGHGLTSFCGHDRGNVSTPRQGQTGVMRIAVTGASGKLGSVVERELRARGHDVVALDVAGPRRDGFTRVQLTDY